MEEPNIDKAELLQDAQLIVSAGAIGLGGGCLMIASLILGAGAILLILLSLLAL